VAGVIDQPLEILHTNLAVYIGIVYAYLPFMVLPIYTASRVSITRWWRRRWIWAPDR
jgi:ABC-type spermidine/putrescine transport system permease subunit I